MHLLPCILRHELVRHVSYTRRQNKGCIPTVKQYALYKNRPSRRHDGAGMQKPPGAFLRWSWRKPSRELALEVGPFPRKSFVLRIDLETTLACVLHTDGKREWWPMRVGQLGG